MLQPARTQLSSLCSTLLAMVDPFSRRLGGAMLELASKKGAGGFYTPFMAAAERAILDRVPHVDLVVEVRDARMPSTSAFECLKKVCCFYKQVIVLNKVDLADHSQTEKWFEHFKNQDYITCGANAHNRDSMKQLLSLIRSRVKELKAGQSNYTATVLLVGIPNVGKSAITNSIHQIGRIGAAEKGKLKSATVSPHPGETKDISSYKIASHPNLYILDSPGILHSIASIDVVAKMALTGAIRNPLIDEFEIARYFLSILNMSEEYKQWLELKDTSDGTVQRKKRQYSSDHTQDFIVNEVRQALLKTITSFEGCLEEENDMERIIDVQFKALHEALKISADSNEDTCKAVATKLLNLYRTGRLGRYTLDIVSG